MILILLLGNEKPKVIYGISLQGLARRDRAPGPHHDALTLVMRASIPMQELVRHVLECNRPETKRIMFPAQIDPTPTLRPKRPSCLETSIPRAALTGAARQPA
jgi:hypothetical protein